MLAPYLREEVLDAEIPSAAVAEAGMLLTRIMLIRP